MKGKLTAVAVGGLNRPETTAPGFREAHGIKTKLVFGFCYFGLVECADFRPIIHLKTVRAIEY